MNKKATRNNFEVDDKTPESLLYCVLQKAEWVIYLKPRPEMPFSF